MIAGVPQAAGSSAPFHEELINLPYAQARERLLDAGQHSGDLFVRVLAPPQPSIGVGELRVARATPVEGGLELLLTYSDFIRP
ncbi:MAG: hypothetical protein JO219_06300 [Candidatus Eremiobacteraeota bacterium]|nr:hypothetical protein [Candidatus Eremiobacteraeota bacterium]MBV8365810.1 hypothetical protein [Candidatus Eremiobacteraeota bacterium]